MVTARRVRLGAVALLVAVGAGAWWWFFGGGGAPVTEAQARRYFDRIVAAAQAKDFEGLCQLNGAVLNCETQLAMGCDHRPFDDNVIRCEDTVPSEAPTVVATRPHPEDSSARILVVEGVDGAGNAFESEVLVFRVSRHGFKAINSVYWQEWARIFEPGDSTSPSVPEEEPSSTTSPGGPDG